jgi:transcriptional regulator with XRE-family HTH domain
MALPRFPWFSSAASASRRAKELAKNDYALLEELIALRHSRELTQADVAELLGMTQQAVSKFEQPGADPRLSTLRQYSHAIGALVKHAVAPDDGQLLDGDSWVEISFTPRVGATAYASDSLQYAANAKRTDYAAAA